MQIDNWFYLHPKPATCGIFKQQADDFVVQEILGYDPQGEGEHIYLWVRKEGLNTAYLAEQIAKFAQLPLRAVTYAGRKDKHSVSEQWFGVHKPGKAEYDWSALNVPGAKVVKAIRHNKKLRTGALKGNKFTILLRNITSPDGLAGRIEQVCKNGAPNYYGPQRFGDSRYDPKGSNLVLAEKMINGEAIRNRNKRSMAISALRSWLFNEILSERIQAGHFATPISGDVMSLAGNASYFVSEAIDDDIRKRLTERDITLSAPLWGKGELPSTGATLAFETRVAAKHPKVTETLISLGLEQERRPIVLYPENLSWSREQDHLRIAFDLPAGTFATSVLREILNVETAEIGPSE
ncbi:tRNA pseudouridine(13) synthase TruD [Paraglaciecola polaris]|uniref:tRNA pseudouridine synthase D n=1 Tax=Paraglaciecola polaris LMG 21857 TaxID=1129793 RepID=K6Z6E1_9ALTE|nr:tRNA pseudouridine(13) synthase TruD [Paraglaciecola polaris]GAC31766.1 tRNA pseudouridine13 synthase [Paraglaciecola polaris LMG 21857]